MPLLCDMLTWCPLVTDLLHVATASELYLGYWKIKCLFIFISPLHVSAFDGHLQVEYTIYSGSYLSSTDPLFLCYRQILPLSYLNVTERRQNLDQITSLLS
jgi:hypothetical protein